MRQRRCIAFVAPKSSDIELWSERSALTLFIHHCCRYPKVCCPREHFNFSLLEKQLIGRSAICENLHIRVVDFCKLDLIELCLAECSVKMHKIDKLRGVHVTA